jgi:hypothetical protein
MSENELTQNEREWIVKAVALLRAQGYAFDRVGADSKEDAILAHVPALLNTLDAVESERDRLRESNRALRDDLEDKIRTLGNMIRQAKANDARLASENKEASA